MSVRRVGLVAGPLLALVAAWWLPDSYADATGNRVAFSYAGRVTAGLGLWMAVWWMTEAIPVYATALLPLAVLPASGAVPIHPAAAPYAHELIFLFMGGFIVALAMERWGLTRRIALVTLGRVGTSAGGIVASFMGITAGLSMFVSNTATTIMMLPIAMSVIEVRHDDPDAGSFSRCLLLGIAYSASIGGIGTLIGTPPNVFLAAFCKEELGVEISFVRWMGVGLPLVAVFLPFTWWLLTRVLFPVASARADAPAVTREQLAALGPMNRGEKTAAIVFGLTALAWISRPLLEKVVPGLTDPGIAIVAALALFVIPVDRERGVHAMDWETAARLPWGLLILFGGGLSLAAAIRANGVGELVGSQLAGLSALPQVGLVLGTVALVIFLTELTSNTATTATLLPLLAGLAPALDLDPLVLVVPAAVAASCAFMLPVATPPNAVVFGSGHVSIREMSHAGIWLNLAGIALITGLAYAVALPLLRP